MYLVLKDISAVANWGLELGKSNIKYMEIPDDLLEALSSNFLNVFKQVLKQKQYNGFLIRKRRPTAYKEIHLENFIDRSFNTEKIHIRYEHTHNLIRAYELDIIKIHQYYENRPDTTTP